MSSIFLSQGMTEQDKSIQRESTAFMPEDGPLLVCV